MQNKIKLLRKQAIQEMKTVLVSINTATKVLNENKSSLEANKNLLENLKTYNKLGERFLGYSLMLEFNIASLKRITNLGKDRPADKFKVAPPQTDKKEEIKNIASRKKLNIFKKVLLQIKSKNSDNELGDYVSSVIIPLAAKALKTIETASFSKLDKVEMDEAAEKLGLVSKFLKDYVVFFKDKKFESDKSGTAAQREMGSKKYALKSAKELLRAFPSDKAFDVKALAREIVADPVILDVNQQIATTSELINIPEFVKTSSTFYQKPLERIKDLFSSFGFGSSPSGGGGVFGRPQSA